MIPVDNRVGKSFAEGSLNREFVFGGQQFAVRSRIISSTTGLMASILLSTRVSTRIVRVAGSNPQTGLREVFRVNWDAVVPSATPSDLVG